MDRDKTLRAVGWQGRQEAVEESQTAERQVGIHYEAYVDTLINYLTAVYGSVHDAEDVAQEAFLRLYQALCAGERIKKPRDWVFVVSVRLMRNVARDRATLNRHLEQYAIDGVRAVFRSPYSDVAARERKEMLVGAVAGLPQLERECFCARAMGMKLREIGRILGMDAQRVSEVLRDAMEKIQGVVR